ncbi:succinate dehydrogenase, cytochrome b556 subunit [Fodinicola acaciae]|uniref:succinate dehydrogenase, cytochrome b556 subunit n=1 Tax=Fodinicola acaciae TaxID=2681555 RepID=UPI0013D3A7CF|nr:succinate dehydrogenase, cytochrome b556 subunit [Fodinicola acaciae]
MSNQDSAFWKRASLAGTRHADRDGVWSWYAHRVTGFLIFVVVLVHVADRALVLVSPESYDTVAAIYTHPVTLVLDLIAISAVLYHALNGIRIALIDWVGAGSKLSLQVVLALWLVGTAFAAYQLLAYPVLTIFGTAK